MRRPFLRIPGSPQASTTVETPAHYALTLLLLIGSFSEVVIGSVEPTMYYVSSETLCKYTKKNTMKNEKDGKKCKKRDSFSKDIKGNRGKGTGKQGARRHVTGSETACLSIRTPARTN